MKKKSVKPTLPEKPRDWKQKLWQSKNVSLIARGLIVSLPVIIILFLISLFFKLIVTVLSPISKILDPASEYPHWTIHLLSFFVLIAFFYLIGKTISGKLTKYYLQKFEKAYLKRIPLYSTIKELVKQFSGFKKMPFKRVVLVDPYNSGVLMTGFVTEEIVGDIYTVFVPTAPNFMNGNIYHVPEAKLKFVSVNSETAMRTVVGLGTGSSALFVSSDNDIPKD